MSSTLEWVSRVPRVAIPARARTASHARAAVRPSQLLAGVAWLAQAVVLGFLAYYLLGDATTGLLTVIGDSASATGQIALAFVGLMTPYLAAAGIAVLVRRDDGSWPLTAAAMVATVLFAGLAEMGLTALVLLFAAA